jgi:CRISP-associated protein Cas1
MEPYRPYVDKLVVNIMESNPSQEILDKKTKEQLLQIPILDAKIENKNSPLMVAVQTTTASLAKCYMGDAKLIKYPTLL